MTKIEAYHKAIADGTISKARARVLSKAAEVETFTQPQLCRVLPYHRGGIAGRTNELEAMGVFKQVGTVKDPESGHEVKEYTVTGNPPIPLARRLSNSALFELMWDFIEGDYPPPMREKLLAQLRQRIKSKVVTDEAMK